MGFMQCVVRIFFFDDILYIVEELVVVVMIDYVKYCLVVSFIFFGVMWGELLDQQCDKCQQWDN